MQNAQNLPSTQAPDPGKSRNARGDAANERPALPMAVPIEMVDAAFDRVFAATLSTAVYTDSVWMLQTLGDSWEKTADWRMAPGNPDPKQVERSCLIKEFCKPVEGVNIPESGSGTDPISGEPTDFSYSNNVLFFGDLACAALVERKRMDGGAVIELSFRGTEKETTGEAYEDKKNLLGGFFMSAYKDLEGHYERHRLLIDEAVRIVNKRIAAGEDINLQVSGHSLGGSMAEIFMKKDAGRIIEKGHVIGCTFGSPGIGDKQSAFSMLVKGFIRLIKTQLGINTDNAREASTLNQAKALGLDVDGLLRSNFAKLGVAQSDLVQYIDPDDPIPKLGLLGGYKSSGRVFFSRPRDRDPLTGEVVRGSLLDISKHSSLAYEASRGFSFMKLASRNARDGYPLRDVISKTLDSVRLATEHATTLRLRSEPLFDPKSPNALLCASVDRVIKEARGRQGMIQSSSPNSRADDNKLRDAMESVGSRLLDKLRARRDESSSVALSNAWTQTLTFVEPKLKF